MKKYLPTLAILAIMILSALLHLWDIDSIGDSNTYYTAAVESMTQSWHNFFYASAEPGGSVTVDKPPLGLQIETLFALVLGVSGFSTVLPNILAGVFSVPLLYHLVKKHFGTLAGILAALVMAVTPVVFAADRNNTQDGLLTFFLLLAAWAFIKSVETGRARWLFLGAVIVGLGFNIKMLQAYLPVPAFFALYFLGTKVGWFKKIGLMLAALAVLVAVSLSWALYVDSVPADERPYIGSSQDNTVIGLITGHNGTSRLFSGFRPAQAARPASPQVNPGTDGPDGFNPNASPDNPNGQAPLNPGGQNRTPFSWETGSPGLLRFFQPPLAAEMSWLLPFALLSLFVIAFQSRITLPVESGSHLGLILWGGWLMTCVVFFSMISGIFHAYYVVMLAPPLGAVVGGGLGYLWKNWVQGRAGSGWLFVTGALVTVAFQVFLAWQYGVNALWMPLALALVALAAILLFIRLFRSLELLPRAAFSLLLVAMLIIPLAWSALTVVEGAGPNLPAAYGVDGQGGGRPAGNAAPVQINNTTRDPLKNGLLEYLEANTQDVEYLVAVESAGIGAPFVLATGRPVLYMGGFTGGDAVVSADDLAQMVAAGELRFVLVNAGGPGNKQDLLAWVQSSCKVVEQFNQLPRSQGQGGQALYDCR